MSATLSFLVIELAVTLVSIVAGVGVHRAMKAKLNASWRRLSPAVPDTKSIAAPYRGESGDEPVDIPHSRKALELLPTSRRAMQIQSLAALSASPATAIAFSIWPIAALGPWSAALGGLWGLGMAWALLTDSRRHLGVLALGLLPLAFMSVWAAAAGAWFYAGLRGTLLFKDSAADAEAERERMADPRYLVGSTERRAASVAMSLRGGGGDITAPSSRDNSTA